jgi:hypothetical protein
MALTYLRPMRRPASALLATAVLVLAAYGMAACGGDDETPPRTDSTTTATPVLPSSTTVASSSGWEAHNGPALFAPGAEGALQVVLPTVTDSTFADSAAWRGATLARRDGAPAEVDLLARAGLVGTVRLAATGVPIPDAGDGCIAWPGVRPAEGAPTQWLVGFARGIALPVPLDSIETLAPADSARLAADAARLASRIPNDTAVAFAGLPFFVRTAYRFRLDDGTTVLVADVTRRIGQEADPREQHVFLVAERAADAAATAADPAADPWRLGWFSRTSGPEDETEMRELLAVAQMGGARVPTLVLGVTYEEGSSYALVTRGADGAWRERWSSAYTGC